MIYESNELKFYSLPTVLQMSYKRVLSNLFDFDLKNVIDKGLNNIVNILSEDTFHFSLRMITLINNVNSIENLLDNFDVFKLMIMPEKERKEVTKMALPCDYINLAETILEEMDSDFRGINSTLKQFISEDHALFVNWKMDCFLKIISLMYNLRINENVYKFDKYNGWVSRASQRAKEVCDLNRLSDDDKFYINLELNEDWKVNLRVLYSKILFLNGTVYKNKEKVNFDSTVFTDYHKISDFLKGHNNEPLFENI